MKKIAIMLLVMIFMGLLCNCSIESSDANPYSRKNLNDSYLNGYGTDDQEIIACRFVYNNETFSNLYGNDFEIKNALCTSEMENFSILIKGSGACLIYIKNDIWCVELTKKYLEKWAVKDYFKCAVDPDDGSIIIDNNGDILKAE